MLTPEPQDSHPAISDLPKNCRPQEATEPVEADENMADAELETLQAEVQYYPTTIVYLAEGFEAGSLVFLLPGGQCVATGDALESKCPGQHRTASHTAARTVAA